MSFCKVHKNEVIRIWRDSRKQEHEVKSCHYLLEALDDLAVVGDESLAHNDRLVGLVRPELLEMRIEERVVLGFGAVRKGVCWRLLLEPRVMWGMIAIMHANIGSGVVRPRRRLGARACRQRNQL